MVRGGCRQERADAGPHQTIMVLGGGVAGMHAALQAADLGHEVVLLERDLALGGHMAQLDKTFPTLDCSLCILSPRLLALGRHPKIRVLVRARLDRVEGYAGSFICSVILEPTYVDASKCIGCGTCQRACPAQRPDPYNLNLGLTKAIRTLYPQAYPAVPAIDPTVCWHFQGKTCSRCADVCPTGAIHFTDRPKALQLQVGALILAGGFELLGPQDLHDPHWVKSPHVLTNLELERFLSATGPTRGVLHPSGLAEPPRRIVFAQCAGSRDTERGVPYCSDYCCAAALKQIQITASLSHVERITLCAMDVRAHGRDCEPFFRRVQALEKVHVVHGKVARIVPKGKGDGVEVWAAHGGLSWHTEADLVVLAMGMRPSREAVAMAQSLGLQMDPYGFVRIKEHHTVHTSLDGVYACGTFLGPKSIPSTVQEAYAAAVAASARLSAGSEARKALWPVPQILDGPSREHLKAAKSLRTNSDRMDREEPLRIGVFVCRCGTNIAGVIDTGELIHWAKKLPQVAYATENLFSCATDATTRMARIIQEKHLNRVVVAACSPRSHLPVFQEVLAKAGLPSGYVRMVNIREQCSWVHKDFPEKALEKAKALVTGTVAQMSAAQPARIIEIPITPSALVLGSSAAALTAALRLADNGIQVLVAESGHVFGGRLTQAYFGKMDIRPDRLYRHFLSRIRTQPRIRVLRNTRLVDCRGSLGHFQVELHRHDSGTDALVEKVKETFGTILIAMGAQVWKPENLYGYGTLAQVMTQSELAAAMDEGRLDLRQARRVLMIQCAGSRNDERPYCSRSCCQQAVAHALEIHERFPHVTITILHRDMRTYGLAELSYQNARRVGIQFLRYDEKRPPRVEPTRFGRRSTVDVHWVDPDTDCSYHERADLLVLSTPTVPSPENQHVASILRVPLSAAGFFMERHVKLAPVETAVEGIFIAGQCHSPKTLAEALVQGNAAASKMLAVYRQGLVRRPAFVAAIDAGRCSRCLNCAAVCPAQAIQVPPLGPLSVDPGACRGCGLCVAECPAGAIDLAGTESKGLLQGLAWMVKS
ncbi:FAD-dependent oxidoreductase [Desulfosoma caldarium]|uniref:Heterodisulfide reductase subunit A n=1 Tax=Desulfosoma caldarium TaxID=610254 RepID=A0A3N1UUT7_9BACT|nr:FAD-dependent oxidoreductase [Desulfosoma caldarium]ROQ92307.1 heterodisulfide reductase subunit A [Desulfosoma caldarium]